MPGVFYIAFICMNCIYCTTSWCSEINSFINMMRESISNSVFNSVLQTSCYIQNITDKFAFKNG